MGLIQNLRSRLRLATRAEAEQSYLNGSTSAIDLEMRQREIDRGRFRRDLRSI
jgi:hypothetical protein